MVKEFKNSGFWAIVLGGSSGLGLASAKKLASHGMNICIVHRNSRSELSAIEYEFEKIKSYEIDFQSFNLDALNDKNRSEILSKLKLAMRSGDSIRCMVHSIAKGNLKPMSGEKSLSSDDFNITIDAMAVSLYEWTTAIFKANLFAEDARIISFTSEGSSKVWPSYSAVSAAKAALEAISRSIALEFAPFGIRSNCIQAGVTDTVSLRMIPGYEKISEFAQNKNPFRRLTLPEDVANAVYLLCKDEAAWINGTILKVDGGEHLQ